LRRPAKALETGFAVAVAAAAAAGTLVRFTP
jgi:hypothetical protein